MNPQSSDWNNFWKSRYRPTESISYSKQRILQIVAPLIKKGGRALDAGCGSGFFSKYFCDQEMHTVALDYSEKALSLAKDVTRGRAEVLKGDLCVDSLSQIVGGTFDVIFSDGLLEHFTQAEQGHIIQNLKSILNEEGTLVTFVPNRWSPWEIIRPFFMPGIDETPFVLSGLIRVHEQNGLRILQAGGVNVLPFAISPEKIFGRYFGMLLYTVSRKNS